MCEILMLILWLGSALGAQRECLAIRLKVALGSELVILTAVTALWSRRRLSGSRLVCALLLLGVRVI